MIASSEKRNQIVAIILTNTSKANGIGMCTGSIDSACSKFISIYAKISQAYTIFFEFNKEKKHYVLFVFVPNKKLSRKINCPVNIIVCR